MKAVIINETVLTLDVTTPAHQTHQAGSCKTFLTKKNKELEKYVFPKENESCGL